MALITQTPQSYYNGSNYGNYQFTSLDNIINQFIIAYIGEDKLIPRGKRSDVAFHAQRAMQELSFDTFKSCKAQEITVPATLQFPLPQDYVNYTKISWVDSAGIKQLMYPTSKTSNPTNYFQNDSGDYEITALGDLTNGSDQVTLDSQYDSILVGMVVAGYGIPPLTTVKATTTVNSVTTITLSTNATPTGNPTDVVLTFSPINGDLINNPNFQISQYYAGVGAIGDDFITFFDGSNIDIEAKGVEIGMLVSSEHFPVGTTVVDIIGHVVYVSSVSNSASAVAYQDSVVFTSTDSDSDTWSNYKSTTPSENNNDDYEDDTYWPNQGRRYGLDPQHAQINGSYYIDCKSGKIHFSSNVSGKTVIIDYISDSLGTDDEMQVHKFAEEAMYKHIAYAMLSTSSSPMHQQLAPRFKKERFAETRKAKLRLSNIKLEEITQILRGKSKQIKH